MEIDSDAKIPAPFNERLKQRANIDITGTNRKRKAAMETKPTRIIPRSK
jgi:hypothetical protein